MLELTITEHNAIAHSTLGNQSLADLRSFDEQHARRGVDTVFDWSLSSVVKAKNYVGVIQTANVSIEILPKIERSISLGTNDPNHLQCRQNLVYMLSIAGMLPFYDRGLASQEVADVPLWEFLIRLFARRLLQELRKGQQHQYLSYDENLNCVRGRIQLSRDAVINAGLKHRVFVQYDDFNSETLLNRVFKTTCQQLIHRASSHRTQQYLREVLFELADIGECSVNASDLDQIRFDRNTERFRLAFEFCRLFLNGMSTTPSRGSMRTFSLLFPMERVFEEFVGQMIRKNARSLGLLPRQVHLQAKSKRRWLLRDAFDQGKFRLCPDILAEKAARETQWILDTKWKRLKPKTQDSKNGVSTSDMYQMFAYSQRYESRDNILLYPNVPDVSPTEYFVDDTNQKTRIRIELIDLNYDLSKNRSRLLQDLQQILRSKSGELVKE
ncbi:MAG TPA: hypothetical protein DD473_09005 [Planctomycetaceae bacterium]|nr:hypothetical protein [Planctomycetaceae bacterium]